jgi:acylphosphatase
MSRDSADERSGRLPECQVHAFVRGRVQGVGFRYFVSDLAAEAGLAGWVRNCQDGSVECVAQGARPAVENLLRQLRGGPPWAEVGDVEVSWEEPDPDLKGFRVVA